MAGNQAGHQQLDAGQLRQLLWLRHNNNSETRKFRWDIHKYNIFMTPCNCYTSVPYTYLQLCKHAQSNFTPCIYQENVCSCLLHLMNRGWIRIASCRLFAQDCMLYLLILTLQTNPKLRWQNKIKQGIMHRLYEKPKILCELNIFHELEKKARCAFNF